MATAAVAQTGDITASSYVGFDCKSGGRVETSSQSRLVHDWAFKLTSSAITQQIEHKLLKRGFQFNVMVVGACRLRRKLLGMRADCPSGQTGLGKSTLINTLFASHLVESKGRTEPDISPRQTTEIHAQSHGTSPGVH